MVDLSTCCCHIADVARAMAMSGVGYGMGRSISKRASQSPTLAMLVVVGLWTTSAIALEMSPAEKTCLPCLATRNAPPASRCVLLVNSTVDLTLNISFRRALQKHGSGNVVPSSFLEGGRRHCVRPPSSDDIGSKPAY